MQKALVDILKIQEFDMQMIRLLLLKQERMKELHNVLEIASDLKKRVDEKREEITKLHQKIRLIEGDVTLLEERKKAIEEKQSIVKKIEEFNALAHELSAIERERIAKEATLSDLLDQQTSLDDFMKNLESSLHATEENSKILTEEIRDAVDRINVEGKQLMQERQLLAIAAQSELFLNYDRLMRKKKNRVVVPVEQRCCSGCHMMVTAQDENLVRKGEQIVQCEHCSRILFWPEEPMVDGGEKVKSGVRQRRRKVQQPA